MAIDRRNINALMWAAYSAQSGQKNKSLIRGGIDNNYTQRAMNALGTDVLDLYGTDAYNNPLYGGSLVNAIASPIRFQVNLNAKLATVNPFFVNENSTTPLEVVAITCTFSTAAGSTSTGYVSKEIQGVAAPGSSCQTGTFNLNATANTLQTGVLAGVRGTPSLVINPGEQLTFNISAVASLVGLYVTVWVKPHTSLSIAQYIRVANGDIATSSFYLNIIPGTTVRSVSARWGTACSSTGTFDITKDVPTDAPGAGTSILTGTVAGSGAAKTTVFPALSATAATLKMAAGDRLSVKIAGTLTAWAQLVVTVQFSAGPDSHIVIPYSFWEGPAVDRTVFVADRNYLVQDSWESWAVISTSNFQLLTVDRGTTAPGAGTGLQTDNTNKGFDTNATLNTPVGSLLLTAVSTKPTLTLAAGDRLGLKNQGTAGTLAGIVGAILLRKL
jgi:hypothetical protein